MVGALGVRSSNMQLIVKSQFFQMSNCIQIWLLHYWQPVHFSGGVWNLLICDFFLQIVFSFKNKKLMCIWLRLKTGNSVPPPSPPPPPPGFGTIAIGREHSGTIDRGFSLVDTVQLPLAANCCHCFSSRTASDASMSLRTCIRIFFIKNGKKQSCSKLAEMTRKLIENIFLKFLLWVFPHYWLSVNVLYCFFSF